MRQPLRCSIPGCGDSVAVPQRKNPVPSRPFAEKKPEPASRPAPARHCARAIQGVVSSSVLEGKTRKTLSWTPLFQGCVRHALFLEAFLTGLPGISPLPHRFGFPARCPIRGRRKTAECGNPVRLLAARFPSLNPNGVSPSGRQILLLSTSRDERNMYQDCSI